MENKYFLGILLVLVVAISACTTTVQNKDSLVEDKNKMMEKDSEEKDSMMEDATEDKDNMIEEKDAMMKKDAGSMVEDNVIENDMMSGFTGNVLAGTKSLYLKFNQADYEKALDENKIIVLYFYASWCPICRAEEPDLFSAFESLDNENVVGFRVNYKDSDTDADETALAQEFGITYQHTKIILKDGAKVLKAPDSWTEQRYLDEINKLV